MLSALVVTVAPGCTVPYQLSMVAVVILAAVVIYQCSEQCLMLDNQIYSALSCGCGSCQTQSALAACDIQDMQLSRHRDKQDIEEHMKLVPTMLL